MPEKPKGSGVFSVVFGLLFVLAFLVSFWVDDVTQLPPEWIVRVWMLFVATVLISWGANRIKTGTPGRTVGQETINFVVSLIGVTFALIALFATP
jgi:hypothetical protein